MTTFVLDANSFRQWAISGKTIEQLAAEQTYAGICAARAGAFNAALHVATPDPEDDTPEAAALALLAANIALMHIDRSAYQ